MVFNSLDYILFLPFIVFLYYIVPVKARKYILLLGSYSFYAFYNWKLLFFLVVFSLVTYVVGRRIASSDFQSKKTFLILGVVMQTLTLAIYKYADFFLGIFSHQENKFDFLVPLGISFITFSGISYLVDVYRQRVAVENRFLYFALYLAFFPKVVQGPIIKYSDFVSQVDSQHSWEKANFRAGIVQVLYGLFMKMVIADRLAVAVNTVYGDAFSYAGATLMLATMLFSLQIYFDFAGYSLVALGSARLFGFTFADNFSQPYLSGSVGEFWKRWHISLNKWLTEYIYIPLGGSRCTPFKRDVNTLVTFGLSGLWHGADWGYVIWGLLNGVYIVIEKRIHSIVDYFTKKYDSDVESVPVLKTPCFTAQLVTFILISFTWIFFRAQSLQLSVSIVTKIFNKFDLAGCLHHMLDQFALEKATYLGLTPVSWKILIVFSILAWIVDNVAQRWKLVEMFSDACLPIRWFVYLVLIFTVILFGMYGYGYSAGAFIYAQF